MKALKLALAISLALNLALCWKLWQLPTATNPPLDRTMNSRIEPTLLPGLNMPEEATLRPLPPDPLRVPSLQSPGAAVTADPDSRLPASFQPLQITSGSGPEAYAEPLPPNPHAVPPWERRVPSQGDQLHRGLYVNPPADAEVTE
jgi:hypothetical protein